MICMTARSVFRPNRRQAAGVDTAPVPAASRCCTGTVHSPAASSVHHGSSPAQVDAHGLLGRHCGPRPGRRQPAAVNTVPNMDAIHMLHTRRTLIQPRLLFTTRSRQMQADLSCWEPLMPSASGRRSADSLAEPHVPTPPTAARPTLSGVTFACSAGTEGWCWQADASTTVKLLATAWPPWPP